MQFCFVTATDEKLHLRHHARRQRGFSFYILQTGNGLAHTTTGINQNVGINDGEDSHFTLPIRAHESHEPTRYYLAYPHVPATFQ